MSEARNLILGRKLDETIEIKDRTTGQLVVTVQVVRMGMEKIRLAIMASDRYEIMRGEIANRLRAGETLRRK